MSKIFLLTSLLFTTVAAAETGSSSMPMSYEALMAAPLGTWAEYTTTMQGFTKPMVNRYSLVEKSKKRMTLEVEGSGPMGAMLMRMEFEPAGKDAWKLAHARLSVNGGETKEWPVVTTNPPLKKGELLGEVIGKVTSVAVPAGSFDCQQFKKKVNQGNLNMVVNLWINDTVPPIGLVKQTDDTGKMVTVLTTTGKGAVAKMTSKPGKVETAKPAAKP